VVVCRRRPGRDGTRSGARRLILDANVLIAYERGKIDRATLDADELAVAAVTIAEYRVCIELGGILAHLRRPGPPHSAHDLVGQCCIGRSVRMRERADAGDRLSDGRRELVECCADPVAGGAIGGEFIVAAAEILHERVPGGDDPRGPVAFQAAHRPQAGFQQAVIGFYRVVRVALDGVQG